MKHSILILFILIAAFGAGIALWTIRARLSAPTDSTGQQNTATQETSSDPGSPRSTATVIPPDTDHDGLSDTQEQERGTDLAKADTDDDELSDREEVLLYATNPRQSDTDGDGVQDGPEVRAGKNPNGDGVLLDLTKTLEQRSTQP